jgi:hypothetical protein
MARPGFSPKDDEPAEFEAEAFKLAACVEGGEIQLSFGEIVDEPEEIPELGEDGQPLNVGSSGAGPASSVAGPEEFLVCVDKPTGGITGLELDPLDKKTMQVCNVRAGVIRSYNSTAAPDAQVKAGDVIVAVNGFRGDSREMIKRFQEDVTIELVLMRPKPWRVNIKQKAGELLSSLKCAASGISLLLVEVPSMLDQHNASNPSRALRQDDRIVNVNGVERDVRKMLEQVDRSTELDMLIIRSVAKSKAGLWETGTG